MKKKIIISLCIFSLLFFLAGIYIIVTIESATATLDNLIMLHQVEILREHLLIQIKRVQSDLSLKDTRFARSIDTVIVNVRNMENIADTCFECHHTEKVLIRLTDLRGEVKKYRDSLSRVLTIRANVNRLDAEADTAFRVGEDLTKKVNKIIALTNTKLNEKTVFALDHIAKTKKILYILVALGPLSIVVLGFFIIRGFTKPVNELLKATKRLEGGNLDYRIDGLKDEFGEVAISFNEMANSLKEQMFKMQRTEQMAVLGELAAGLAHEIKNPLAGIKVSMEVLAEEQNISEEDRQVVRKVIEEIGRIELLIKSLLNFARPPKPQLSGTNVNDVLDKTIKFSLKHPSLSSGRPASLKILRDFDKGIPDIMADPVQLQQIFLNLFLNSINAMPEGGTIAVKTFYDKDVNSIHIEISDTGKGVDKKIINRIFQPFFTTKPKGTGLGLAITKRLVEQHEGSISVENRQGGGVVFHIVFPVKERQMDL